MELVEAIRLRKSVRGYKVTPVPEAILSEVLDIALMSPSGMNTQPWEISVVTGEALEKLRKGNVELLRAGIEPHPEIARPSFEGVYRQRQVDLAVSIFKLMGIEREDKEKRAEWMERGFRIFDAPAAIIISMDSSLDKSSLSFMDIGALMQTICLAALNYGLATCIEDQGVMYPEVVRRVTGIPETKRIIICIAIGYPDWDFPANSLKSTRLPLENVVTWCR